MMSEAHRGLIHGEHTDASLTNTSILSVSLVRLVHFWDKAGLCRSKRAILVARWLAAPCSSCMTMTAIIGCRTPWHRLPHPISPSPVATSRIFKARGGNVHLAWLFASVILHHVFFFFSPSLSPALPEHLICKNHMFTFEIKVSPSPSPFFIFLHLKMDSFHYASQQRAVPAHAAHSEHTD